MNQFVNWSQPEFRERAGTVVVVSVVSVVVVIGHLCSQRCRRRRRRRGRHCRRHRCRSSTVADIGRRIQSLTLSKFDFRSMPDAGVKKSAVVYF